MAKHIQGIAITIKAFLPTGSTIDEQFATLGMVKDAHASGDYSAVLKVAKIDEVKSEQKTRRVDDEPVTTEQNTASTATGEAKEDTERTYDTLPTPPSDADATSSEEVPAFLKNKRA